MSRIDKNPLKRGLRLASIPANLAGHGAMALGRRLTGQHSSHQTAAQQRAAEHVFEVLGNLKGGALKFGQALSVFEGSMPAEMSENFRASLTKLQDSAPPLDTPAIKAVLAEELGPQWRDHFADFDEEPAAAASIGQVHRATLADGTPVAVKVQYPGADEALRNDLKAISRLGRVAGGVLPGMDMRAILHELEERMIEELDYTQEADNQRAFAEAFADSDRVAIPDVHLATSKVLVTTWLDGEPLHRVIADGSPEQRNDLSQRYLEFLLLGPKVAGLLHADPHPGNFLVLPDGRFAVLDFGAVKRLPTGMPTAIGRLLTLGLAGDNEAVVQGLREEGFIKAAVTVDADELMTYLEPFLEPARVSTFTFRRQWLADLVAHVKDPSRPQWSMGLKLNLPPEYLLIHRVWTGGIGVLCQLGGTVPVVDVLADYLPEFDVRPSSDR